VCQLNLIYSDHPHLDTSTTQTLGLSAKNYCNTCSLSPQMFVEGLRWPGTNTWVPAKEPAEAKMLVNFRASSNLQSQGKNGNGKINIKNRTIEAGKQLSIASGGSHTFKIWESVEREVIFTSLRRQKAKRPTNVIQALGCT